ncbi:hypothetical protein [Streptomyces sp. NPDC059575]|uniref:hypothetical protein n=1 Tax=Streptomyces sp. NPDC059575 TaxID=3346872 RepID=UPI00369FB945
MTPHGRSYRYVGPAELRAAVRPGSEGRRIGSATDFGVWAAEQSTAELAEPFTFVVGMDGALRLAPRRSEHVACAGGDPVLGAGEITFAQVAAAWAATDVTNHSTGYCPDTSSWPAVSDALSRAGLAHPDGFTHGIVFRRCPGCQEHNIVRENDFVCVFCGEDLPDTWNIDPVESVRPRHDRTSRQEPLAP